LVFMGGPMSVHDESQYQWLPEEKVFLREALSLEDGPKILGICLGAQLLAEALGADVFSGRYKEIGWFPVEFTPAALAHPLFEGFPELLNVFHWHGETFSLPEEAVHLARSEACENQAFLYEEQTRRGVSLQHFEEMNDIADHCTICHRCLKPCPVNIDFGDVTVHLREILKRRDQRRSSPVATASMAFLNSRVPRHIRLMRKAVVEWGYKSQRLGHRLFSTAGLVRPEERPQATTGKPPVKAQIVEFVRKPMPPSLPSKTMRALLGVEDDKTVPILRKPGTRPGSGEAVFYFPGCGSERLFSQVGLATLAMATHLGAEVVLPPGYLCCGYPQNAGGDLARGKAISTENRVLFHRIANTLNYMDIKTVMVSCGTCMDQLLGYEFERIFPGCRLIDIHEYLLEKGVTTSGLKGRQYLYHEPCHTPMKHYDGVEVGRRLLGADVRLSDRCCGEAGTFAVSRPDIATQVRFRKLDELKKGIRAFTGRERVDGDDVKMLTSCPACQQGLERYREDTGLVTEYIVVELANDLLGEGWQKRFVEQTIADGLERVLL